MEEVAKLFMEENDIKALKKLYEVTQDKIIQILINWKENYEEMEYTDTNEFMLYDDIINYIFEKYNL